MLTAVMGVGMEELFCPFLFTRLRSGLWAAPMEFIPFRLGFIVVTVYFFETRQTLHFFLGGRTFLSHVEHLR